MRKYKAAPHPFIIEPPLERKRIYKPEEEFQFGLTLIGRAIDYLPYFIYTFEELGRMGIGKGKSGYDLISVESNGDRIYDSQTKTLKPFTVSSAEISEGLSLHLAPYTPHPSLNTLMPVLFSPPPAFNITDT